MTRMHTEVGVALLEITLPFYSWESWGVRELPESHSILFQRLPSLATSWNHLGTFKKYWCLGPIPTYSASTGQGRSLGIRIWESSLAEGCTAPLTAVHPVGGGVRVPAAAAPPPSAVRVQKQRSSCPVSPACSTPVSFLHRVSLTGLYPTRRTLFCLVYCWVPAPRTASGTG